MGKKPNIRIDKAGAFRIRSAEASRATIKPFSGTPPKPRTPMPDGQVAGIRSLNRKSR